jgi:hypothetical protein
MRNDPVPFAMVVKQELLKKIKMQRNSKTGACPSP